MNTKLPTTKNSVMKFKNSIKKKTSQKLRGKWVLIKYQKSNSIALLKGAPVLNPADVWGFINWICMCVCVSHIDVHTHTLTHTQTQFFREP